WLGLLAAPGMVGGQTEKQPPGQQTAQEQRLAQQVEELNKEGSRLYEQGKYAEAAAVWRRILDISRRLYPEARYPQGHPNLASSINDLALLYRSSGEYGRAEPLFQEALAMNRALFPKKTYPNGHPDLAETINNLAVLYWLSGEYGRAQPLFQETLA